MIQILGARGNNWHHFFENKWRAESIADLHRDLDFYLSQIPIEEHYNLFFTVANCNEVAPRNFSSQKVIPFDIDYIDTRRVDEYVQVVCQVLQVGYNETIFSMSGHGLHAYIELEESFGDPEYFNLWKEDYDKKCDEIQTELERQKLVIQVGDKYTDTDKSAWAVSKLMRLPGTKNIKKGKDPIDAYIIQPNLAPQSFKLTHFIEEKNEKTVAYAKPDTQAVLKGCSFLQNCQDKDVKINDAQRTAAIEIIARLDDGPNLCHQLSGGDDPGRKNETNYKVKRTLANKKAGPKTCEYIDQNLWSKCSECKHYGKITTPIQIKSEDYPATEATGFHTLKFNVRGELIKITPNYEDLVKAFKRDHQYISISGAASISIYNGTYWENYLDDLLKKYAQDKFRPNEKILKAQRDEFVARIKIDNMRSPNWVAESIEGTINLPNGILDTETMQLLPHSPEYGHTYVLNYSYDPHAKCPIFDRFLDEITCKRRDLAQVILEFIAFGLSNHKCNPPKAMILFGEGANGKSTLLTLIRKLVGQNNCASLDMGSLNKEVSRTLLTNKLFNISEETPYAGLKDTAHIFKDLTGGGIMITKTHYKMPVEIHNRAKFIFACNELPKSNDTTRGMIRRFLIIPFDRQFLPDEQDRNIDQKLEKELPGILNRVIAAYKQFKNQGDFTHSLAITRELTKFQEVNDYILAWINECVEVKPLETHAHLFEPSTILWEHFQGFMKYTNSQKYNLNWASFIQRLPHLFSKGRSGRAEINGEQVRGYQGIISHSVDAINKRGPNTLSIIKNEE